MSATVRVANTVRRTAGPWTPTIHRLLRHLHGRGIAWVPLPLGMTDEPEPREVLTFLPGTVPQDPMPAWVWTDAVLVDAAARLAALHGAGCDFDTAGGCWQLPVHAPAEVICHNDFAPYNLVFDAGRAIAGVIDWDTASPGPRVWDVAYLAYRSSRSLRRRTPTSGGEAIGTSAAAGSRCCARATVTTSSRPRWRRPPCGDCASSPTSPPRARRRDRRSSTTTSACTATTPSG